MALSLVDILTEELRSSKEKAKTDLERYTRDLDKYKSAAKMLYGKISSYSIDDILQQSSYSEFKRISEAVEKMQDKIDDEKYKLADLASDMFDEYQDEQDREAYELYKEINAIVHQYQSIVNGLEILDSLAKEIVGKVDHFVEYGKLKHLKDFQEALK